MLTKSLPHSLLAVLTEVSHLVMVGGAIALYLTGKLSESAFVGILAGFGGAWSGVAGVLISTRQSQPSTASGGGTPAPGATVTPDGVTVTPPQHST